MRYINKERPRHAAIRHEPNVQNTTRLVIWVGNQAVIASKPDEIDLLILTMTLPRDAIVARTRCVVNKTDSHHVC